MPRRLRTRPYRVRYNKAVLAADGGVLLPYRKVQERVVMAISEAHAMEEVRRLDRVPNRRYKYRYTPETIEKVGR